jgi:hypothetical protein
LRGEIDVRPLSFTGDLDAVRECRSNWESPTGATVYWDVLISLDCEVVCAVDRSPPVWFWEAFSWELF